MSAISLSLSGDQLRGETRFFLGTALRALAPIRALHFAPLVSAKPGVVSAMPASAALPQITEDAL
jgi:hypothetical protein